MVVMRVTICALPVQQSVTVMTGQENVRNSSNDSKKTPHDRSYLSFKVTFSLVEHKADRIAYQGILCNWK